MKPILAPIDFSASSAASMQYAASLAGKLKTPLVVLHVYELPVLYGDAPYLAMQQLSDEIKITAQKNLERTVNLLRKEHSSVEVTGILRHGIPVSEILDQSADSSVVVMGNRGQSKIERLLIGSTTERVFHHSEIPVLCIPSDVRFKDIRRLVFATDLEEDNLRAAETVVAFAAGLNASVDFIYINRENSEAHELKEDELTEKMKSRFNYPAISGSIIDDDDIAKGLQAYVNEKKADVLCMFTHERTFPRALLIPSVTARALHALHIPLMVLHQHK